MCELGSGMNIFVAPFPPVPGVRYQVTATNESGPLWSRDGTDPFYRVSATGSRPAAVHRVEVRSESPFTFTNEETLPLQGFLTFPNYTNYDLTPDGERVLVVVPGSTHHRIRASPDPHCRKLVRRAKSHPVARKRGRRRAPSPQDAQSRGRSPPPSPFPSRECYT